MENYFSEREIEESCPFVKAQVLEECASTNSLLKEKEEKEYFLLAARSQTSGRGRLQKSFLSPKGGLYFSLFLEPKTAPKDSTLITAAAAVAAARAIEKVSQRQAKIKWVNDIYIEDKKVCGILTEGKIDAKTGALKGVVLGIGINAFKPEGGLPKEIKDIAESLFWGQEKKEIYLSLLTEFLWEFKGFYENLSKKEYMKEYINRSYLTGKTITFFKEGKEFSGRVTGIDENANLIVLSEEKEIKLFSSEVSVKL